MNTVVSGTPAHVLQHIDRSSLYKGKHNFSFNLEDSTLIKIRSRSKCVTTLLRFSLLVPFKVYIPHLYFRFLLCHKFHSILVEINGSFRYSNIQFIHNPFLLTTFQNFNKNRSVYSGTKSENLRRSHSTSHRFCMYLRVLRDLVQRKPTRKIEN